MPGQPIEEVRDALEILVEIERTESTIPQRQFVHGSHAAVLKPAKLSFGFEKGRNRILHIGRPLRELQKIREKDDVRLARIVALAQEVEDADTCRSDGAQHERHREQAVPPSVGEVEIISIAEKDPAEFTH
jgi:hypothetical protein